METFKINDLEEAQTIADNLRFLIESLDGGERKEVKFDDGAIFSVEAPMSTDITDGGNIYKFELIQRMENGAVARAYESVIRWSTKVRRKSAPTDLEEAKEAFDEMTFWGKSLIIMLFVIGLPILMLFLTPMVIIHGMSKIAESMGKPVYDYVWDYKQTKPQIAVALLILSRKFDMEKEYIKNAQNRSSG